jgi:hypothetical protein
VSEVIRNKRARRHVQRTLGSLFEGFGTASHNGNSELVTAGFLNW